MSVTDANIAAIRSEMAAQLGYKIPPVQVSHLQAAVLLGLTSGTLAVWRSTGRYELPYCKIGRQIRYRLSDLAAFMACRTRRHTGLRA